MHNHEHHHSHGKNLKRLALVLMITTFYMFAEFIGGYITNSLTLIADAGHMLSDVVSLALSFVAIWFASKKATLNKTFGYHRGEIIAAFLNGLALIFIACVIIVESYHRFINIEPVSSLGMLSIAVGGLIVNIVGAYILHQGSEENLNVKGAYLHVLADLLGSMGAIAAGLLMFFFELYIADPIISCAIAILVLLSSFGIIKSAFDILMESVPENIDINAVHKALEEIEGVKTVFDLHIWCISTDTVSLSAHLVSDQENNNYRILSDALCLLKDKFDIKHSTIQIEPEGFQKDVCPFG